MRTMQKKAERSKFPILLEYCQSDLDSGICSRLMVFVVVLQLFEGVLKVFVGANFRIKRAQRTQK